MSQSNISPRPFQETEEQPDLSVVIVSWNVRDLLVQCLRALLSDEVRGNLKLEVIVVDNASADGTVDALRPFEGIRVIEAGENLGYGRGNNQGFCAARGRRWLVLNPDTIPLPGSLEALVRFADTHPRAGLVSARLLNADGTVQPAAFKFPTLLMAALDLFQLPTILPGRIRHWVLSSRINGRYPEEERATRPFRIDHPLGACMLVNPVAYRQCGGFDPLLHMYSEEVDLAMRLDDASWECWQVPYAQVIHLGGQSTRQLPDRMFVELWRSRLYVYSKHYALAAQIALRAMLAVSQFWVALKTLLALRKRAISRDEARRRWNRAGTTLRLALQR